MSVKVADILQPARWIIPNDFMSYAHFVRAVHTLEWKASVGYPYYQEFANKGQFFSVKDGIPCERRMQEVWVLVCKQISLRRSDPIRVFIKPEAHSLEKISDGRLRVIYSVSVIDCLIDTMLFEEFNNAIVEKVREVPVKVGWTPYLGGWKQLPSFDVATDNSSHDQSVRLWQCSGALLVRELLCSNLTKQWSDLAAWRYQCLYVSPLIVTELGFIYRQIRPGIQKSGVGCLW